MTLTTSLRNVGVGLVIASSAFADTPAVTAALAYGLFAVVASLLLALVWARFGAATARNARDMVLPTSPVTPVATQTDP
jgi:predicted Na+-dependent transporter